MICKISFKDNAVTLVDLADLGPTTMADTPAPYQEVDFESAQTFKVLKGMAAANLKAAGKGEVVGWSKNTVTQITTYRLADVSKISIYQEGTE